MIKIIIRIFLLLLVVYNFLFSFFKLEENEIVYVRDFRNGEVVDAFTGKYNYVWQGLLPWIYNVSKIKVSNRIDLDVSISIPELSLLEGREYHIRIPLEIEYLLIKSNLPRLSLLYSVDEMKGEILNIAKSSFEVVFAEYLNSGYVRDKILRNKNDIFESSFSLIGDRLKSAGILVQRVQLAGMFYIPEMRIFREGVKQSFEIRKLAFMKKKEILVLEKQLSVEKNSNELYFLKLKRVSSLIKDNPDILKFIYIDKMASNIKVIISSDKTGMPSLLGMPENQTTSTKTGEIDNLR